MKSGDSQRLLPACLATVVFALCAFESPDIRAQLPPSVQYDLSLLNIKKCHQAGDFHCVVKEIEKLRQTQLPFPASGSYYLADALSNVGNPERALRVLEQYLPTLERDSPLYIQSALLYQELGGSLDTLPSSIQLSLVLIQLRESILAKDHATTVKLFDYAHEHAIDTGHSALTFHARALNEVADYDGAAKVIERFFATSDRSTPQYNTMLALYSAVAESIEKYAPHKRALQEAINVGTVEALERYLLRYADSPYIAKAQHAMKARATAELADLNSQYESELSRWKLALQRQQQERHAYLAAAGELLFPMIEGEKTNSVYYKDFKQQGCNLTFRQRRRIHTIEANQIRLVEMDSCRSKQAVYMGNQPFCVSRKAKNVEEVVDRYGELCNTIPKPEKPARIQLLTSILSSDGAPAIGKDAFKCGFYIRWTNMETHYRTTGATSKGPYEKTLRHKVTQSSEESIDVATTSTDIQPKSDSVSEEQRVICRNGSMVNSDHEEPPEAKKEGFSGIPVDFETRKTWTYTYTMPKWSFITNASYEGREILATNSGSFLAYRFNFITNIYFNFGTERQQKTTAWYDAYGVELKTISETTVIPDKGDPINSYYTKEIERYYRH